MKIKILFSYLVFAASQACAGGAGGGALESTQWLNNGLLTDQLTRQTDMINALTNKAYSLAVNSAGQNTSLLLMQTSKLLGDSAAVGNSSAAIAKKLTQTYGNSDISKTPVITPEQYKQWAQIARQSVRNAMINNGVILEQGQSETDKLKQLANKAATSTDSQVDLQKLNTEVNLSVAEQLQTLNRMNAVNALISQTQAEKQASADDSTDAAVAEIRRLTSTGVDCFTDRAARERIKRTGICK